MTKTAQGDYKGFTGTDHMGREQDVSICLGCGAAEADILGHREGCRVEAKEQIENLLEQIEQASEGSGKIDRAVREWNLANGGTEGRNIRRYSTSLDAAPDGGE